MMIFDNKRARDRQQQQQVAGKQTRKALTIMTH